jgi:hypothetical protein
MLARHAEAKADGDALVIPAGTEASLYIAMGLEPLVIDRVSDLLLESEAIVAKTRRKERYVVAYEDIRAVRLSPEGSGRAGYSG